MKTVFFFIEIFCIKYFIISLIFSFFFCFLLGLNFFNFLKLNNHEWVNNCRKIKKEKFLNNLEDSGNKKLVNPYLFFHKLSFLVNKNAKIFTDAGANLCWCLTSFKVTKQQKLISAWGNSPMGYSVSAGIGACYAEKKQQIISSIGDGSFLINVQEMQFLKHHLF